jgi:hypothetical protein
MPSPRPSTQRPWSLRERLSEHYIANLVTAYRDGATAASLATVHGVSLKSVKRVLHTAGIRRRAHPLETLRKQRRRRRIRSRFCPGVLRPLIGYLLTGGTGVCMGDPSEGPAVTPHPGPHSSR